MYFKTLGFAVYSQIIFNTHIIITSSESVAGFIKGLMESFWIKCGSSESDVMSRLYVQTGPCQQVGSGWGSGGLILVLFLSRDLELVLGKLGPFWASMPLSASNTNHTLMSNTEIFFYANTHSLKLRYHCRKETFQWKLGKTEECTICPKIHVLIWDWFWVQVEKECW